MSRIIVARLTPRHREAASGVSAFIGEDSDNITINFTAEACDVEVLIDLATALELHRDLGRQIEILKEFNSEGKYARSDEG